jgi:hypothetical protein
MIAATLHSAGRRKTAYDDDVELFTHFQFLLFKKSKKLGFALDAKSDAKYGSIL